MASGKRTKGDSGDMATVDEGKDALLAAIRQIWESARFQAAQSVNSALVQANWLIGKQIIEAEQGGKSRAAYSRRLLKTLSETLEKEYGSGFSVSALQYMRAFYLGYPALLGIQHAPRVELGIRREAEKQHAVRVESSAGSASLTETWPPCWPPSAANSRQSPTSSASFCRSASRWPPAWARRG